MRQRLSIRGGKNSALNKTNLKRRDFEFSRKCLENFGHGRHIVLTCNNGCLTSQLLARIRKTRISHGTFEEIILYDVHFRAGGSQPVPQFAEIADLHPLVVSY